jgi:hypothetical protein
LPCPEKVSYKLKSEPIGSISKYKNNVNHLGGETMDEMKQQEKQEKITSYTEKISEVCCPSTKQAAKASDPFLILGNGAPIFRAMFTGIQFPIKDRRELTIKAGGEQRVLTIPNSEGGEIVYSLLDILDAVPELDKFFPMQSAEDVAKQFARMEIRRKRERKTSPLLKIKGKHISEIHRKPVLPIYEPTLKTQFAGFSNQAATGATLLSALKDSEGQAILRALSPEHYQILLRWIEWLHDYIISRERNAALAAATRAEEQANAAEAAANAALDATRNVATSPTNELAQQAVDQACTAADQAVHAATEAANAAAESCSHAGAVPDDTEAQAACSRARAAASRAQAAADRARGACQRARDIASIGMVTICGHVTEEDPCCNDDWSGATIEVCNVNYPEIPCSTTTTDGNGNYCVTGRFGHSSRVGCSTVSVTMNAGPSGGDVSQTKQISVCSSSPANVDFTFDAPGTE